MKILKGLGAAEGIAFAKAFVLKTNKFSGNRTSITEDKIPSEIEALKIALAKSKDEVASLQKKRMRTVPMNKAMFSAHIWKFLTTRRCLKTPLLA